MTDRHSLESSQEGGKDASESKEPFLADQHQPSDDDANGREEVAVVDSPVDPTKSSPSSSSHSPSPSPHTSWIDGKCCQEVLTVFLFCFINFLNFMNRYSTPPIVGRLKTAFHVEDMHLGLVQTCFELCYVFFSPLFGFMGDRWSRRVIIATSLLFSTVSGVLSSFVPESSFALLLVTRSLLGIAEASYTNICPSIIGDLFVGKKRTLVLTVYQFAIPLGCGVGYISSSVVADYTGDWRWAFRLTPLPMFLSALCLLIFVREPQRGEAENAAGRHQTTSYWQDLNYLIRIPSFILTSLAFVGVSFSTGALCYWTPDLFLRMLRMKESGHEHSESEIGFIFGLVTIASGVFGVAVGVLISNSLLKKFCGLSADGIVCGAAMLFAAPVLYGALVLITESSIATWVLIFFGIAALSCCLVLLSEITLNVVIPTRRATAEAFQTTISHLFGDAASTYVSGLISDYLRWNHNRDVVTAHVDVANFSAMQSSLFLSVFVVAASGGLFLFGSLCINEDAAKSKQLPLVENIRSPTKDRLLPEQKSCESPA